MYHTAQLRATASLDIHHGAHGCSGSAYAAEESGDGITYALSDEFAVGVVLGLGDVIGHDRCEQRVDGAESGQCESRHHRGIDEREPVDALQVEFFSEEERLRQSGRNLSDGERRVDAAEERHHGHQYQRHQCGGDAACEQREEVNERNGAQSEHERCEVGIGHLFGQVHEHIDHHHGRFQAHERIDLLQDDDHADTAHETREHGIGYVAHILADANHAEEHLKESAEHSGQCHGDDHGREIAARCGPRGAHQRSGNHRHRSCGTTNLRVCAPEN